jgi:hypothetical protein
VREGKEKRELLIPFVLVCMLLSSEMKIDGGEGERDEGVREGKVSG